MSRTIFKNIGLLIAIMTCVLYTALTCYGEPYSMEVGMGNGDEHLGTDDEVYLASKRAP